MIFFGEFNLGIVIAYGICVWINYRRAKIKNSHTITGFLLAIFLNLWGVGIFYFMTRARSPKPQVNSMTSLELKNVKDLAIEEERTREEREFLAFKIRLQTLPTDELLEAFAASRQVTLNNKYLPEIILALDLRGVSTELRQLAINNHQLEINKLELLKMQHQLSQLNAQQRAGNQLDARQREAQRLNQEELQRLLAEQNKRRISWGFGVWF